MVNTKPSNPYLSEQTRLEAQRRMLAERYGLYSDESDDAAEDDAEEEEGEDRQQPRNDVTTPATSEEQQQQSDTRKQEESQTRKQDKSDTSSATNTTATNNANTSVFSTQPQSQSQPQPHARHALHPLHPHHINPSAHIQQQHHPMSPFHPHAQAHTHAHAHARVQAQAHAQAHTATQFPMPPASSQLPSSISSPTLPSPRAKSMNANTTRSAPNNILMSNSKPAQTDKTDTNMNNSGANHEDEKNNKLKTMMNNANTDGKEGQEGEAKNDGDNDDDDELPPPIQNGFPPIELIDRLNGNKIYAHFNLSLYKKDNYNRIEASKEARVTQIALYSSQLLETHNRKIAVSNQILSYAVGGHIRALLRHSSPRCLLKGHSSVVADIEFLSYMESRLDNETNDHISILGSVADDGSVYVWKLIRSTSSSSSSINNNSSSSSSLSSSSTSATSAHNDDPNCSFNIADAIRFEHPDYDKGKSYKRIAFRPGPNSIIAENGIGVAMLLLDMHSMDLRIVELVKMNDKMMVRDKFLRSRNEIGAIPPADADKLAGGANHNQVSGNLQAAAWVSETTVVTSRGGYVFLWNVDNTYSNCIGYVPRSNHASVTDIHVLSSQLLVFVIAGGKSIEVWEITKLTTGNSSTDSIGSGSTVQNNQVIELFDDSANNEMNGKDDSDGINENSGIHQQSSPDIHCVTSIDPAKQILFVSNVKRKCMIVLHFNSDARAFDTITEIPLKNHIYSCSVAPIPPVSSTSKTSHASNNMSDGTVHTATSPPAGAGGPMDENSAVELGVWCIQPTGIQVIHLPTSIGRPDAVNLVSEVHPKPRTHAVGRGMPEKKVKLLSPSQVNAATANKNLQQQAQAQAQIQQQQYGKQHVDSPIVTMKRVPQIRPGAGAGTKVEINSPAAVNVNVNKGPVKAVGGGVTAATVNHQSTLNMANAPQQSDKPKVPVILSRGASGTPVDVPMVEGTNMSTPSKTIHGNTNRNKNEMSKKSMDVESNKMMSLSNDNANNNTSATSVPSKAIIAPAAPSINEAEFVESILSAAKKVVDTFEESGMQREAHEKVKAEKLMESVAETAESNMEAYINSSMKKVLAETLIPGVSEIIADSRKSMKKRSKLETEMSRQHFEQVMQKADITASFNNGCVEMSRQVGQAVSTSLTGKFDCVVTPAVDVVHEAIEDLGNCVATLRDEVKKARKRSGQDVDDDEDEEDEAEDEMGEDDGLGDEEGDGIVEDDEDVDDDIRRDMADEEDGNGGMGMGVSHHHPVVKGGEGRRRGRRRGGGGGAAGTVAAGGGGAGAGRRGVKGSSSKMNNSRNYNQNNNNNVDDGGNADMEDNTKETEEMRMMMVRDAIDKLLSEGKVNDAFFVALDKGDVDLVLWLCGKFNPEKLFIEHELSQVALMSLAHQLGQQLSVGDVMTKVNWLLEVAVALEPDSEDIAAVAMDAVHELDVTISEARRNRALLAAHVGLERKLKTLSKLIGSHLQQPKR